VALTTPEGHLYAALVEARELLDRNPITDAGRKERDEASRRIVQEAIALAPSLDAARRLQRIAL
jgi:hypothetical protein